MLQIKPNRTHGTRTRNTNTERTTNPPPATNQSANPPDKRTSHPLDARYLTYTNTRTRISTYLQPQWLVPTHVRSTARPLDCSTAWIRSAGRLVRFILQLQFASPPSQYSSSLLLVQSFRPALPSLPALAFCPCPL